MLVIRFLPIGKKNQPTFRIVVTEKKNAPRAGRRIENLGFYNPLTKEISVKKERILYWISKGAKCSDSVHNLLIKQKVIEGKKIDVHKKSKKKQEPSSASSFVKTTEDKKATAGEAKPAEAPKTVEAPKAPEAQKPIETPKPTEQKPEEKKEEKPIETPKLLEKKPEEKPAEKIESKPIEPSFAKATEDKEKK